MEWASSEFDREPIYADVEIYQFLFDTASSNLQYVGKTHPPRINKSDIQMIIIISKKLNR